MSELIKWIESVYTKAKTYDFEWIPFGNPQSGPDGVYTDMFFEKDGKYQYIKYTIRYVSRCDERGISHPQEGVRYYVLFEVDLKELEERKAVPDYEYGRFRYVFDDEETAKKVVAEELLMIIYPYQFILNKEEIDEWYVFEKQFSEKEGTP